MTIREISSLRQHLQWAIELEHATIPPYLCALYSIKEGHNPEATEILRSIFMEEMLHMILAANVLNAIGGRPVFDSPDFIPNYPSYLPYSNKAFKIPLAAFSQDTISLLMRIERPESSDAQPEDEQYETIGQFYAAIKIALKELTEQAGEEAVFSGDPSRQIGSHTSVYAGSGQIIPVTDLASAIAAIDEIMHQGEGLNFDTIWDGDQNMFHHEKNEISHYFRLHEILEGRCYQRGDTPQSGPTGKLFEVDWSAVYDVPLKPSASGSYPDSDTSNKIEMFSRKYCAILQLLERGFNGEPESIGRSVGAMYGLKQVAIELMQLSAEIRFKYQPPSSSNNAFSIKILPDGPYAIQGDIPLTKKRVVRSEAGEALAWSLDGVFETQPDYALCRCGASSNKPFCDGSHATIAFDGDETDIRAPYSKLQINYAGKGITMQDVRPLCVHAGFCHNRITDAWKLSSQTEDIQLRTQLIAMIEHCPSGALTYTLDDVREHHPPESKHSAKISKVNIEPDLVRSIAVLPDGPLWVTGGISIIRSDDSTIEVRNRVTLCRCGHSQNKPFCDGTHAEIGFKG